MMLKMINILMSGIFLLKSETLDNSLLCVYLLMSLCTALKKKN